MPRIKGLRRLLRRKKVSSQAEQDSKQMVVDLDPGQGPPQEITPWLGMDLGHDFATLCSSITTSDPRPGPDEVPDNNHATGHATQDYSLIEVVPWRHDRGFDGDSTVPAPTKIPIFELPYSRNDTFVNNSNLLDQMSSMLDENLGPIALIGLGGIGKTQTALEYAHRHKQQYDVVFWISCNDSHHMNSDINSLAYLLGLGKREDLHTVVSLSLLQRWLIDTNLPWLLILDDIGIDELYDFLPIGLNSGDNARKDILITSRDPAMQSSARTVRTLHMQPLSSEDGVDMIRRLLNEDPQEDAMKIVVELLGGLPLALACVCGYMRRRNCSITEFIELFQSHKIHSWDTTTPRGYNHTLTEVFQLTFDSLPERAMELLSLLAMFNPDRIPATLHKRRDMSLIEFFESRSALLSVSLITMDRDSRALSMHRIVQFAAKNRLTDTERVHLEHLATEMLSQEFPDPNVENRAQCADLIPHVAAIMEYSGTSNICQANVAYKAAQYLWNSGSSSGMAKLWACRAADVMVQNISPENSGLTSALGCQILAGQISLHMCDFSMARRLLRNAEMLWQRLTSQNCNEQSKADIRRQIWSLRAATDYHTGMYSSAEQLLRQTIDEYASDGIETIPYAENTRMLAITLQATGRYDEGLRFAEQAVAMFDHLNTDDGQFAGRAKATLSELYEYTGRFDEALSILGTIVPTSRDEIQASQLSMVSRLAAILLKQNKNEEALSLALRVSNHREIQDVFNPVLAMRTNDQLRILYQRNGDLEKAEVYARRLLDLSRQYWGHASGKTVSATLQTCILLRQRNASEEAAKLCLALTQLDVDERFSLLSEEYELLTDIAASLQQDGKISQAASIENYLSQCLEHGRVVSQVDDRVDVESVGHDSGYETGSQDGDESIRTDGLKEVSMWMKENDKLAVLIPSLLDQYNLAKVQRQLTRSFKNLGIELHSVAKSHHEIIAASLVIRGRRSLAYSTISILSNRESQASQQMMQLKSLAIDKTAREWTIDRFLGQAKSKPSQTPPQLYDQTGTNYNSHENDDSDPDLDNAHFQHLTVDHPEDRKVATDMAETANRSNHSKIEESDLPFFQASIPFTREPMMITEHDKISGDITEILQRFANLTDPTPSNLLRMKSFVMGGDPFEHFYQSLVAFGSGNINITAYTKQNAEKAKLNMQQFKPTRDNFCDTYGIRLMQVSTVSFTDRAKLAIQIIFGESIIWWPLQPPRKLLRPNTLRLGWNCPCGHELSMDISNSDAARRWIRQNVASQDDSSKCSGIPPPVTSATASQSSLNSYFRVWSRLWSSMGQQKQISSSHDPNKLQPIRDLLEERFVHWCVQAKSYETALNHIRIIKRVTKDCDFIRDLRKRYRQSRHWRWFVTLNECSSIKLVKFVRIHKSREIVQRICSEIPVPDNDYEIDYHHALCPDPEVEKVRREIFIRAIEGMLIHRYHYGCAPVGEDLQNRIPKRKTRLEAGFEVVGHGLHADEGFAPWRLLVLLVLTQPTAFVFAWYYLSKQQAWDLQTAFVPWVMIMTLIAMVLLLPGTVAT